MKYNGKRITKRMQKLLGKISLGDKLSANDIQFLIDVTNDFRELESICNMWKYRCQNAILGEQLSLLEDKSYEQLSLLEDKSYEQLSLLEDKSYE